MMPSIEFVKRADGVNIAFAKFGSGRPLVYPAAWVSDLAFSFEDHEISRFWGRLSEHFCVVLYDKHGCGQSDRNRDDFSLEAELKDLVTVSDHLNLNDITLFGMSCAGPVALEYAYLYPNRVSHLILYSTWMNGTDIVNSDIRSAIAEVVKASWGFGSKMMTDLLVPDADPRIANNLAKMQRACCSPELAANLLLLGYSLDVSSRISDIRTPGLILHREKDKTVPVKHGRTLASELPNAMFKVLKGNIHLPWLGNSMEIIREIIAFVHGDDALTAEVVGNPQEELNATIVFTDIVSSTRMVERLGDKAARDIFNRHDRIIRDQVENSGGKILQNLGDGFMLSFETASTALRCAIKIQSAMSTHLSSVSVRIGINAGEVIIREGEHPFGQAVVMAARIVDQCSGGKILLSEVTRQLCAGSNFNITEAGTFLPKGFDKPAKLFELLWKNSSRQIQ
jgi:class 3 adenylate cyclase/pimeloyl-ACP methyl ester carboxylesterase